MCAYNNVEHCWICHLEPLGIREGLEIKVGITSVARLTALPVS